MDKDEIIESIMTFFGDTSRSASETKEGLLDIAERAQSLADSISDDADDE